MKFFLKIFLISVQLAVLSVCEDAFDYCSLNGNVCGNAPHIACDTLEAKLLKHLPPLLRAQINVTTEKLSDSGKIQVINLMNAYRNKIALGQTILPKGSNLPKTVWDDELELIAKSLSEIQLIADEVGFCFNRRNGNILYTNLVLHNVNPKTAQEALQDIIDNAENNREPVDASESFKRTAFISKMGCYFGHAHIIGKNDVYQGGISCLLDFDMDREAVNEAYIEGEPCTKCKNDVGCDSEFAGLCATA